MWFSISLTFSQVLLQFSQVFYSIYSHYMFRLLPWSHVLAYWLTIMPPPETNCGLRSLCLLSCHFVPKLQCTVHLLLPPWWAPHGTAATSPAVTRGLPRLEELLLLTLRPLSLPQAVDSQPPGSAVIISTGACGRTLTKIKKEIKLQQTVNKSGFGGCDLGLWGRGTCRDNVLSGLEEGDGGVVGKSRESCHKDGSWAKCRQRTDQAIRAFTQQLNSNFPELWVEIFLIKHKNITSSIALLHKLRELPHLLRPMKYALAPEQSDNTGLYCCTVGGQWN